MNKFFCLITILSLTSLQVRSQYTEIINSNRPGASYSAFAVGTKVIQGEAGFYYERRDHSGFETEGNRYGMDYVIRYGFLFEQLELIVDGTYTKENITDLSTSPSAEYSRSNFTKNTIGAKYLVFDPFRNPEKNKPNLYSWKANNYVQWRDLIPAVAVYAGANFNLGDNPFYPDEPTVTPKVMVATQNHLGANWVLVMNFIYDKFTSDDPIFNYVMTLTHALPDPRYSVFIEHQGFKSDAYGDGVFRGGAARLFGDNMQVDISMGVNIKDTPSRFFGAAGLSYRLDFHQDKWKSTDEFSGEKKGFLKGLFGGKKNKENPFEEIDQNQE
ncbi:transporter [Galbibacter sp. EGI 63066]|uniref:transporter n=1 Tax=Galbibacter sp. EGI 63066 TaxID=2993559 RepID=UPI00224937D6|nr:transporter [Galbibacter sp. EGI 63066]MCX2681430.1 transporter [Galbibacter sp. EGI 63066]